MNSRFASALALAVAFAGAVLIALIASRNNLLPNNDEIYHLLAARGLLQTGDFAVGLGSYGRASLYTRYLAGGFAVLGDSIGTAKALTALTFGLLIVAVFAFLRGRAGTPTAILCCALLALAPHSLEFATTVRFYMPQALLFWLGAVSVYCAVAEKVRPQIMLPAALVCWSLATHLQPVTVVGVGAVAVWVLLYGLYRYFDGSLLAGYRPTRMQLALALAALVALISALVLTGVLGAAIDKYTTAAEWNRGSRLQYYYWVMTDYYNPFWSALPLAALLVLRRYPALGGFALCVFAVSFVTLSFAGMKEDRYLYFALPFFFLLIGIGVSEAFGLGRTLALSLIERSPLRRGRFSGRAAGLLAAAGLAFFVIGNLGYVAVAKDLADGTAKRVQPRWDLLTGQYRSELLQTPLLVTNRPNYTLYFLDRVPVSVGLSRLKDLGPDASEFSVDYRTGSVLIGSAPALSRLLACVDSGMLIAEQRQWNRNPRTGISRQMVPIVESHMQRIDLPEDWGLRLYRWDKPLAQTDARAQAETTGAACSELRRILRGAQVLRD